VTGQTEAKGSGLEGSDTEDDFLARERAALGDDADQFATPNDRKTTAATVEDGDEDLLGGDYDDAGDAGVTASSQFDSDFPSIDTTNNVCPP
jgi:hypothetical protein